jgi:hypothetical protein
LISGLWWSGSMSGVALIIGKTSKYNGLGGTGTCT